MQKGFGLPRHFGAVFVAGALLLGLGQGCAVAPLSNHITARTNGRGDSLASLGGTIATNKKSGWLPSLKYSLGLRDDLDLGFQYEVIQYGLWAKYAFLNQRDEGFAFSGLAGVGTSFEGFYGYVGPIISWKTGWFEPYLMTRFNYVDSREAKMDLATVGEFTVKPGTYRYFQHTVGFMAWPLHWFGGGLEASSFATVKSPFILEGKEKFLLSGNFSFRF